MLLIATPKTNIMKKLLFLLCSVITSHLLIAQSVVGVPHITVPGITGDNWKITTPANLHYIDGKFYTYPDLDNTKQSKLAVIKSLLLSVR